MQQIFASIDKGDPTALNNLMDEEQVDVKEPPAKEEAPLDIVAELVPDAKGPDAPEAEVKDDGTKPPDAPVVDDWRTKLPDDVKSVVEGELEKLKQERDQLQQYYRSNEGRVSALQKQINTLKTNDTVKAPPAAASTPITLPTDDAFEELKTEDPALYEKLKAREALQLKAINDEIAKVRQEFNDNLARNIAPIHEAESERALQSEAAKVLEAAPDIREIVGSEQWKMFKGVVPPGVKSLAESGNAEEMLTAVWMFRQWAGVAPPQFQQQEQQQAPPAATATVDTSKIEQERQRKLAGTTDGTKTPPVGQRQELDEAAMIEAAFQSIREKDFKNRIF
jgi:hypothetical protein